MKITVKKPIEYMPGIYAQPGQSMDVDDTWGRQLIADGLADPYQKATLFKAAKADKASNQTATQKSANDRPGDTATEL
jgi:hypothetical protein